MHRTKVETKFQKIEELTVRRSDGPKEPLASCAAMARAARRRATTTPWSAPTPARPACSWASAKKKSCGEWHA